MDKLKTMVATSDQNLISEVLIKWNESSKNEKPNSKKQKPLESRSASNPVRVPPVTSSKSAPLRIPEPKL